MEPQEKKSLSEMQAHVMHMRYRLEWYRFNGIVPPAIFIVELKMAKRLADLELKDDKRIDVKI